MRVRPCPQAIRNPFSAFYLDSCESSGDSVIDATATNTLHPLRDKASVARHTIHKPSELSKSCSWVVRRIERIRGRYRGMPGRSPGFGGRAPRSRQKTGGRERESGDFVDVVGFYPVREAGAGRSFGPDRWPTTLHESRGTGERCCFP